MKLKHKGLMRITHRLVLVKLESPRLTPESSSGRRKRWRSKLVVRPFVVVPTAILLNRRRRWRRRRRRDELVKVDWRARRAGDHGGRTYRREEKNTGMKKKKTIQRGGKKGKRERRMSLPKQLIEEKMPFWSLKLHLTFDKKKIK